MPIGVPRVPYRYPGDSFTQWISIYERLSMECIIFLSGEVTDGMANSIIARLLYFDSEDQNKDMFPQGWQSLTPCSISSLMSPLSVWVLLLRWVPTC